jgi:hypothetical protein
MYRNYCNERGCPGHVKNWESCLERRIFASPASATGPIRELLSRPADMSIPAGNARPRALAASMRRSKIG